MTNATMAGPVYALNLFNVADCEEEMRLVRENRHE